MVSRLSSSNCTLLTLCLSVILHNTSMAATVVPVNFDKWPPQHAVLVWCNGNMLLEKYWSGSDGHNGQREFGPAELHDLRSCTKSVVGLLTGIAIHEGKLAQANTPAYQLFPELMKEGGLSISEKHQRITLEHLLLMQDGLAWNQKGMALLNNEHWLERSKNSVRYVWSRPMAQDPGRHFNYNSGATVLLGGAIQRAVGKDIEAYAAEKLFEPLGITDWEWMQCADPIPAAHYGLRMTPRDMLKIGRLVLDNGRWNNAEIVPQKWMDASVSREGGRTYGYQWWLDNYEVGDQTIKSTGAGGKGGQYILVFPSLNAVIVMTAGHYDDDKSAAAGMRLVEQELLPRLVEHHDRSE